MEFALKDAIANNDVSYCNKINVGVDEGSSVESARSECVGLFNKVKSQIDSGSSECGHDAICLTAMAVTSINKYSQDPRFPNFCMVASLSDNPPNNNFTHCVAVVARNKEDISICNLLDATTSQQCRSEYSGLKQ